MRWLARHEQGREAGSAEDHTYGMCGEEDQFVGQNRSPYYCCKLDQSVWFGSTCITMKAAYDPDARLRNRCGTCPWLTKPSSIFTACINIPIHRL